MSTKPSRDGASLSESQKRAVTTFGSDVCVSAGAGSGKTSVLVHRFVHAVAELGDPPQSVLALTFTEKAANHMKRRLVDEFTRLGREADRRALETAYIGTIHSFCARLLRENPIEAGVDPYYKVLSEGESEILMARVMDTVFEASADRPEWLGILVEQGERRTRAAILRLYEQYRSSGEDERLLRIEDSSVERAGLEVRIRSLLKEGVRLAGDAPSTLSGKATIEAARTVPGLLTRGKLDWTTYRQILRLLKIDKRSKALKDWATELEETVKAWGSAALQELFAPSKAEFLRVFREVCRGYENQKRACGTYDFEDLPLLSWKLLSGPSPESRAIRERYRVRFRHIFVDEFQDTSPLQAKLIDLLRGKGNLFVVGDPQQSIYAFRHADPALFEAYHEAAGTRVALAENYRSRSSVLEFANAFFSNTFAEGRYRKLLAGKRFALKEEGGVEILYAPYEKGTETEDLERARLREADRLARRLKELVESGARVEDKEGSPSGRPIKWGDVAILMRGATHAPIYERALSRHGIPFYSVKSKGFFERPEVRDFMSFLTLMDHPEDDVALAAVLRSPLAGVSDDGLYWLARAAKSKNDELPLSIALELPRVEELSDADRVRTAELGAFLASARATKNSVPVSELLERAARWSGYECSALAVPGGVQRVANVRKLVDLARSLEQKTALDAAEFVRHLRGMAEREDAEWQARVEAEGGDAVLLSTIHAAKGLEFPCVAVVNLGGRQTFRHGSFAAASVEGGLGWSLGDEEGGKNKKKFADRAYELALAAAQKTQAEEESRLFYVAMTRAKERLLLTGAVSPDGETWMKRLLSFVTENGVRVERHTLVGPDPPDSDPQSRLSLTAPPLPLSEVPAILGRTRLPEKEYDLAVDLSVSDVLAEAKPVSPPVSSREPEEFDPEDLERSPRNEYGTLFHRVMELATLSSSRGSISEELFSRLLAPLTEKERREVRTTAAAFWKGSTGQAVRHARRVYPELPFLYKTPFGMLKGQIDLAFQEAGGDWGLLDYKTNEIALSEMEAVAESYRLQLELYALVFGRVYGEFPKRGVLYFATLDQTAEFEFEPPDFGRIEGRLRELTTQVASGAEPLRH